MKADVFLWIYMAFFLCKPTLSGYRRLVEQQTHGRTFNVLDLLPFTGASRSQFNSLNSKVSGLETTLNELATQLTLLQLGPKCPFTSPFGSRVVGQHCYFVYTTPTSFGNAIAICNANGGFLAEPLPQNGPSFYSTMKNAFNTQFDIILTNGGMLWIGAHQITPGTSNPFFFISNNVAAINPVINLPVLPSGSPLAAAIANQGASWSAFDPAAANSILPFVCQFTTVI